MIDEKAVDKLLEKLEKSGPVTKRTIVKNFVNSLLAQDREGREFKPTDPILEWDKPMTSKQAARYLLTRGFVAVELYNNVLKKNSPDPLKELERLAILRNNGKHVMWSFDHNLCWYDAEHIKRRLLKFPEEKNTYFETITEAIFAAAEREKGGGDVPMGK